MARRMQFQLINFRKRKPQTHLNQERLTWGGKLVTPPCLWAGRQELTSGPTEKSTYFSHPRGKFSHPESQFLLAWNLLGYTHKKTLIKFEKRCTEKEKEK